MSLKFLYGAPASMSLDRRSDQPLTVVSLLGEVDLRVHTELREMLCERSMRAGISSST
jgi:hypothetical protein